MLKAHAARKAGGAHPGADGMLWMSRQDDQVRACVLFGDRVHKKAFAVIEDRAPIDEGLRFDDVIATAHPIGTQRACTTTHGMVTIADLIEAAKPV